MTSQYAEAAKEAICSALYSLEFTRFLGERPDPANPEEDVAWFRLSRDPTVELSSRADPKQVMVSVYNELDSAVTVHIEWLNLSGESIARGGQYLRIVADPEQDVATRLATEQAVLRVLEVFSNVLEETGVAGPIELIAPESAAGDEDDPDDMALPDDEVGRG